MTHSSSSMCTQMRRRMSTSRWSTRTSPSRRKIETSCDMDVDIVSSRTVGRRCGGQPTITSRGGVKASHPCTQTSNIHRVLARAATCKREQVQHSKRASAINNDGYHHKHRQMIMTTDGSHGDKDDKHRPKTSLQSTSGLKSQNLPRNFTKTPGEPNRPLTPILLKNIAIHLPFLSRYFCKSIAFLLAESSILCCPKRLHTHIFVTLELISQLHRTSVTQGCLAGIVLCTSAPS